MSSHDYKYLTSYVVTGTKRGKMIGNIRITSPSSELSYDDIEDIRELVRKDLKLNKRCNIIITNIIPLPVKHSKTTWDKLIESLCNFLELVTTIG